MFLRVNKIKPRKFEFLFVFIKCSIDINERIFSLVRVYILACSRSALDKVGVLFCLEVVYSLEMQYVKNIYGKKE